jgi:glycerophosphoryl diester phosphodiesterase
MDQAKRPFVIAHRGFRSKYPENSLSAIKAGIALPVNAVEFDVELTKDDNLVLIHQETLEPDASGTKLQHAKRNQGRMWIRETNLSDIIKLDAGSWFDHSFSNEKISTLDQALKLDWGSTTAIIELKDPPYFKGEDDVYAKALCKRAIPSLDRFLAQGNLAQMLSFSPAVHLEVRSAIPHMKRVFCVNPPDAKDPDRVVSVALELGAQTVCLDERYVIVDSRWRTLTAQAGILLGTYEASPDLDEAAKGAWTAQVKKPFWEKLCQVPVDTITTDFPDSFLEYVAEI